MRYLLLSFVLVFSACSVEEEIGEVMPTATDVTVEMTQQRSDCAKNIKKIGFLLSVFAEEQKEEMWPAIDTSKNSLTPLADKLYPEYLWDLKMMYCPADTDAPGEIDNHADGAARQHINAHSYWYFGYTLYDEATALKFIEHYKQQLKTGDALQKTIDAGLDIPIMRLQEGIERFFITDMNDIEASIARILSQIPILVERPENHGDGGNVFFMDGHVEFMPYPGKYPMTVKVIEALRALDDLKVDQ